MTGPEPPPTALLDACVLYPPLVRRLLLDSAAAGAFRPAWSRRILDEWVIASARNEAEPGGRVMAARAAMEAHFPAAMTEVPKAPAALHPLPDPADDHVLEAAVAAGAAHLVTFNLRDFPARSLAAHGIEPRHPDGFLWEILGGSQGPALARSIAEALAGEDRQARRRALKRARLPRLGKAVAAG